MLFIPQSQVACYMNHASCWAEAWHLLMHAKWILPLKACDNSLSHLAGTPVHAPDVSHNLTSLPNSSKPRSQLYCAREPKEVPVRFSDPFMGSESGGHSSAANKKEDNTKWRRTGEHRQWQRRHCMNERYDKCTRSNFSQQQPKGLLLPYGNKSVECWTSSHHLHSEGCPGLSTHSLRSMYTGQCPSTLLTSLGHGRSRDQKAPHTAQLWSWTQKAIS